MRVRRPRPIRASLLPLLALTLILALVPFLPAAAYDPANAHFQRTWSRTDQPVQDGAATRTWMWGPDAFTPSLREPYEESPGGQREVQYFDKSRMEITFPSDDSSSPWYVTNGLLVVELVTGQLQVGDAEFEDRTPAQVNVAGDFEDPNGPTYATIATLLNRPALAGGATITQRVDRLGVVTNDAALASYGVTAAERVEVPGIDHQVASPFWAFMNSSGAVYEDGGISQSRLFQDPFYATGYPIAEAYWADVQVGGDERLVLMQCFQRRCLTYTPDNPAEWQVEAGNVGRHYYCWRYACVNQQVDAELGGLAQAVDQLVISFPPGALAEDAAITITGGPPVNVSAQGCTGVSASFLIDVRSADGADEVDMLRPVTLVIYYDAARLPDGQDEDDVTIGRFDEATGEWELIDTTVDTDQNFASASVDELSTLWSVFSGC